jgi:hypothetical protein
MSMTFAQARRLHRELVQVQQELVRTEEDAVKAEALWAEFGDPTPVTLWSAAQKQSFTDIRAHTDGLIAALNARTLSA